MAYTYSTYIAALKAATVTADLITIKTDMQTDMTNAGLNATLVSQVNAWLDQITTAKTFKENFLIMNDAGALFTILMGLNPPESSGTIYFNDPVVISPGVSDTGAVTTLTVINSANTGQTASTAIPSVLVTTNSRQWLTGAIVTQKEFEITAPTYSFVAASTITDAYTFYVDGSPVAGTNATITNRWAAGVGGNFEVKAGVAASFLRMNIQNTEATGYSLFNVYNEDRSKSMGISFFNSAGGVGTLYDNNTGFLAGTANGTGIINQQVGSYIVFAAGGFGATSELFRMNALATAGAVTTWSFTGKSMTGQTLSTEIPGFLITSNNRQWATGAIITQRETRITTPTYSFVGASTITTAYSFFVDPPTAGANCTITNNYAAGFNGHVGILTSLQLGSVTTLVTSTFLKFGASTTAKSLMNLTEGAAPTAPVDGDVWREDNTNTGLKIRIGGVTKTIQVA